MNEIAGMLVSALGQGFIYAPMALGVFLLMWRRRPAAGVAKPAKAMAWSK